MITTAKLHKTQRSFFLILGVSSQTRPPRLDHDLTQTFTIALKDLGFSFPATVIDGRATNLKPLDDGYFIRDAAGRIFHVKRVLNRPEVVAAGIAPSLDVLDIIVSENGRREFRGVIITRQGDALLISWDDYRLTPLPVQGYDSARMDPKLLIDPLYRTVTVSSPPSARRPLVHRRYPDGPGSRLRHVFETLP